MKPSRTATGARDVLEGDALDVLGVPDVLEPVAHAASDASDNVRPTSDD
jgi:hypothetical protein